MKLELKRKISAWLLLSVFVSMMAVVSFHHHDAEETAGSELCESCIHHVRHSGHLGVLKVNLHDCLLCQLQCASFLAPAIAAFCAVAFVLRAAYALFSNSFVAGVCGVVSPRAPPYILS